MMPTLTSQFHSKHCSWQWLLRVLGFVSFTGTWAHYIIDDNDPSVIYLSNHGTKEWSLLSPGTNLTVPGANGSTILFDYRSFYSQTVHDAYCNNALQCQIAIPFTGSGITIYGVVLGGTPNNYTFTLNGNLAAAPVYPVIPELSPPIYNYSLYDLQALPLSRHTLTITIVNWNTGGSELTFDYAFINETNPSQATPSASAVPPSRKSHFSTGAVIGVICAGLVVFVFGIFILVFLRRRRQRRAIGSVVAYTYIDNELDYPPFDPYNPGPQLLLTSQRNTTYNPVLLTSSTHYGKIGSSSVMSDQYTSQPGLTSHGGSLIPLMPSTSATESHSGRMDDVTFSARDTNRHEAPAQTPPSAHTNYPRNQLSPEQADLVHNLHNLNVPTPAIALVMDTMMRRPEVVDRSDGSWRSTSPQPPQYTP